MKKGKGGTGMKKALRLSFFTSLVTFTIVFVLGLSSKFYSISMKSFIEDEYPGFMTIVEDYGTNSYEPVYEGYSKGEVIALEALNDWSFSVNHSEKYLKQSIKDNDPFNNGSNDERIIALKEALKVVQTLKDKYYVKAKIIDGLLGGLSMAGIIFFASMLGELISFCLKKLGFNFEKDYEAEKDNRFEEEYPPRKIMDKPKGLN